MELEGRKDALVIAGERFEHRLSEEAAKINQRTTEEIARLRIEMKEETAALRVEIAKTKSEIIK